jgi:Tfp pilus assembly protein PilF
VGKQNLGFEGTFAFAGLPSGSYLLTIEQEDGATIARPLLIKNYPTPKTVFIEIRLGNDGSATIQEVVKEFSASQQTTREEIASKVPPKALKELEQAGQESARNNPGEAILHLKKALAEAPEYFEAYKNLGAQYQKLQQWDLAMEAFRKAISLREESAKPHLNLGSILWKLGREDEAIQEFEKALKFDATLHVAQIGLGMLQLKKKSYLAAEEHLDLALRLNPKESREGFITLIRLEIFLKDPGKAHSLFQQFQAYFPGAAETASLQSLLDGAVPAQANE